MMNNDTVIWQALEYDDQEKGNDWFWALGVIALCAVIISVIYKNYLFAIFVVIGAFTMGMFANQKPKMVNYELSPNGLKINDELLVIESIKGYAIRETRKNKQKILILQSTKIFSPIITIPIEDSLIDPIKKYFDPKIPEKELHEPAAHQIMDAIGF